MSNNRPTQFDAVVVGAGPAGSSAAIWLARAGWKVALVEKQRFPRRKVCGECIAASNLPLLHALGIGAGLEAQAGASLRRVRLLNGSTAVSADLPAADHPVHRWGRALGRETLDTLLLQQARVAGAEVLQPWSVQAISGAPGDWRCDVRALESGGPLVLRAPLLIDAHGSWEHLPIQTRAQASGQPGGPPGQQPDRHGSDLFAFKANFVNARLDASTISVLALDGGYGGMVLEAGGMATVACCVRRDRLNALRRAAPSERAGEVVQAWLQRECAGVQKALAGANRKGLWLASGPLDPGWGLSARDTIFRVGNAAGEAHPILGEGISMALQSASVLCALLLQESHAGLALGALAQAQVQRRYVAAWQRQFGPRLRLAAVFAKLAMRPYSAAVLMAVVRAWPDLLTHGARWGGKVHKVMLPQPEVAASAPAAPPLLTQEWAAAAAPAPAVRQAGLAPLVL